MKIYVCGAGHPNMHLMSGRFNIVSALLEDGGDIVLNPAVLPSGLTQREYMQICIAMVNSCDAIFLLNGWELSKGAQAEFSYAEKLGLKVMLESEHLFE